MFIDSHTHLYAAEFDADRYALVKKAKDNGISAFYMPNIDSASIEPMLAVEKEFPGTHAMMGLHPCHVNAGYERELLEVEQWLQKREFAAIGETGIDLYWDKTFFAQQQEAFIRQLNWALQYDLGIVIHCRNAFDEIYDLLKAQPKLPRAIFHCFSGTLEQAEKVLALGDFKLGIGGVVTFKNAGLDKVVAALPLSSFVLETDAPYLAPVPFRGKRNEPVYMMEVARKVAEIRDVSIEEVGAVTSQNAVKFFTKENAGS